MLNLRSSSIATKLVPCLFLAGACGCTAAVAQTEAATPSSAVETPAAKAAVEAAPSSTLQRVYRGKTVCTASDGSNCGTDHWTMFLHQDGSRVMQVASETSRAGEVRHATIIVEADGVIGEAFMHNRSPTQALGSSYVLHSAEGVDQAFHNGPGLSEESDGITVASLPSTNAKETRSIGTGPVAADGFHFLQYDMDKAGDQPREVFWMGGSYGGTLSGSYRPSTYTFVGEEKIKMPEGYDITTDHFRMASGSEVWLTQGSRIVVRADVRFGPSPALKYKLVELKVTPLTER